MEEKGEGTWGISGTVRSGVQLSTGGMGVGALKHRE